jgi:hypothetical protein
MYFFKPTPNYFGVLPPNYNIGAGTYTYIVYILNFRSMCKNGKLSAQLFIRQALGILPA